MDVKETVEVIDFAIAVLTDVAAAKEDGLSAMEMVKIAVGNAPAAVRAAMGSELVVEEMKDLDKEELKLLADKAMELSKAVMAFFAKAA